MGCHQPDVTAHTSQYSTVEGGNVCVFVCMRVCIKLSETSYNIEYRNTFNQLLYVSKQTMYIFKIVRKMSIKITVKNDNKLRSPLSPLHTMHCLSSSHTSYDDVPLRHDYSGHKCCCLRMCLLKLLGRVWKVKD